MCVQLEDIASPPPPKGAPPDTTPPTVVRNGDALIRVLVYRIYVDLGARAADDRDGAVPVTVRGLPIDTSQTTTTPFVITYTANDTARNQGNATRRVEVYDDCPLPEYTCPPAEGAVVTLTTSFRCSFKGMCDARLIELAKLAAQTAAASASSSSSGSPAAAPPPPPPPVVVPDTTPPVITVLGSGA